MRIHFSRRRSFCWKTFDVFRTSNLLAPTRLTTIRSEIEGVSPSSVFRRSSKKLKEGLYNNLLDKTQLLVIKHGYV